MLKVICDGCNKPAESHKTFGILKDTHYCPDCASIYEAYLDRRAKLYEKVRAPWKSGLVKL